MDQSLLCAPRRRMNAARGSSRDGLSGPHSDRLRRELGEEIYECGVDLLRMRPQQAVRAAFDLDELHAFDHFRLPSGCYVGGQDMVVITVNDHGRQLIARYVLAEILKPGVH